MAIIKLKDSLKKKSAMLSIWGCEDRSHWAHQSGYLPLKKILGNVIVFDPRVQRINLGSEGMKKRILEIASNERPDYFFFLPDSKEMNLDFIERLNKASPETKTIAHFGDDDLHFATRSRYYALFVDCCLVGLGQYVPDYKKDGIKNAFPLTDAINTDHFRNLNIEKIYDVSFVGSCTPKSRVELAKFLVKRRVKLNLWGRGWEDYPEFKDIYHGVPDLNEYVKIINQTKINLSPSKGQYGQTHMTSRAYEIASCLSFGLVDEHEEYLKHLGKGYKKAMFKDNDDLLKKINYFLKNEGEREKIASETQKKVIRNHDMATELKKILYNLSNNKIENRNLPNLKLKYKTLNKEDFENFKELKKKVEGSEVILFSIEECKKSKFKEYLMTYSIEKTGKQFSCCEYFISSGKEDYITFKTLRNLREFDDENLKCLLNLNQIAVRKEYFLKNLKQFKKIVLGEKIDFISEKNTAFIEIPLTSVKTDKEKRKIIKSMEKRELERSFQFNFLVQLYSLKKRRKLVTDSFGYKFLFWVIMSKNWFVFEHLIKELKSLRSTS